MIINIIILFIKSFSTLSSPILHIFILKHTLILLIQIVWIYNNIKTKLYKVIIYPKHNTSITKWVTSVQLSIKNNKQHKLCKI
jgi:hypothetical protein